MPSHDLYGILRFFDRDGFTNYGRPLPVTTIHDVLDYASTKYGVPVDLAIATAWNESGLNPDAVGDNGTSFGLFQLHEGGELGSLTEVEAKNPLTNAETALAVFKSTKPTTDIYGLGLWAAAAQRPADAASYAARVDQILVAMKAGQMPDSYSRALGASTDVTLPTDPPAVTDPPTEEQKVEDATVVQAEEVKDDTAEGKVGKARAKLAELKVHFAELEDLLK